MLQVGTFFKRSLLWIWGVSQVVLFAPFMAGALAEQVAGIWCALPPMLQGSTQSAALVMKRGQGPHHRLACNKAQGARRLRNIFCTA